MLRSSTSNTWFFRNLFTCCRWICASFSLMSSTDGVWRDKRHNLRISARIGSRSSPISGKMYQFYAVFRVKCIEISPLNAESSTAYYAACILPEKRHKIDTSCLKCGWTGCQTLEADRLRIFSPYFVCECIMYSQSVAESNCAPTECVSLNILLNKRRRNSHSFTCSSADKWSGRRQRRRRTAHLPVCALARNGKGIVGENHL